MRIAREIVKALREGRATSLVDGTAIVVMTEEEEAAIVAKLLEPVLLAFQTIRRLDKTPAYRYGEAAPNEDIPPSCDRWITPREKAEYMIALLSEES